MAKKVTKNIVEQAANKYNETTQILITHDNQECEVTLYPYLSPQRINKMLTDLQYDVKGYVKYNIDMNDQLLFAYISAMICMEFSDIYSPKKTKFKKEEEYFKTKIQYFHNLINTDFYGEIIEAIDSSEIEKVYRKLFELKDMDDKIQKQITQMQKEIANLDIKNKEIEDKFQNFNEKPKRIPEA